MTFTTGVANLATLSLDLATFQTPSATSNFLHFWGEFCRWHRYIVAIKGDVKASSQLLAASSRPASKISGGLCHCVAARQSRLQLLQICTNSEPGLWLNRVCTSQPHKTQSSDQICYSVYSLNRLFKWNVGLETICSHFGDTFKASVRLILLCASCSVFIINCLDQTVT